MRLKGIVSKTKKTLSTLDQQIKRLEEKRGSILAAVATLETATGPLIKKVGKRKMTAAHKAAIKRGKAKAAKAKAAKARAKVVKTQAAAAA